MSDSRILPDFKAQVNSRTFLVPSAPPGRGISRRRQQDPPAAHERIADVTPPHAARPSSDEALAIPTSSSFKLHQQQDKGVLPDYKDQTRPSTPPTITENDTTNREPPGGRDEVPAAGGGTIFVTDVIALDDSNRRSNDYPLIPVAEAEVQQGPGDAAAADATAAARRIGHWIWLAALVIVVVAFVGGFCGSGKCSGDSNAPVTVGTETSSPTSSRRAASLLSFINNITFSEETLTYPVTTDSAASLALQWLIEDDPLQLSVDGTAADVFRVQQRYALSTMWFATEDWSVSEGWLTGAAAECDWFGIACSAPVGWHVSRIDLTYNNIHGRIPADIALLTALRELDIQANNFFGTLPSSIGTLSNLEKLWIAHNDLTGTMPEAWSGLTSLEDFFGCCKGISGTLPAWIGQWTNLLSFHVSSSDLHGTIPDSIANWSRIQNVVLFNNDFTGTVPSAICDVPTLSWLSADCISELGCSCCSQCYR